MRKIIYILYALWAVLATGLKIAGLASWWVATSWLWFPLLTLFVAILIILASAELGKHYKRKENLKIPDCCQNCLHYSTREYSASGHCLGEDMGETHNENEPCAYYRRLTKS